MVSITQLSGIAITFVVVGIVLGIGADVLDNVDDNFVGNTTAATTVGNATDGISEIASWLPTIGLILAAAVIIGILFTAFRNLGGRKD